ncbi:MAG: hypothetical protein JWR80_3480 [Bradyrhizobium sp.]|nr:hypothetical protein [Bradyrhizobium sp.]
MNDILFLLGPSFQNDEGETCYCGDSVAIEGMLGFFPTLRRDVEVRYLEAARPREPIIELIGEKHQSLPVLIIADPDMVRDAGFKTSVCNGRSFISQEAEIRRYLSTQYGVGKAA